MKGSILTARRGALGLNCSQAAEYLGVDRSTLVRWEKSEDIPRLAAAGAETLLRAGAEVEAWIGSLKPAARRAVKERAEGWGREPVAAADCPAPKEAVLPAPAEEMAAGVAAGVAVETLRRALKVKLFQFGARGVESLSSITGISIEQIRGFAEGGALSVSQFAAIMDVFAESEGI